MQKQERKGMQETRRGGRQELHCKEGGGKTGGIAVGEATWGPIQGLGMILKWPELPQTQQAPKRSWLQCGMDLPHQLTSDIPLSQPGSAQIRKPACHSSKDANEQIPDTDCWSFR